MLYVWYCPSCCIELCKPLQGKDIHVTKFILCKLCKKEFTISTDFDNFFVLIDIEFQIRTLLSDNSILQLLCENSFQKDQSNNSCQNVIRDGDDTKRYKNCKNSFQIEDNQETVILSFNGNVDGAKMLNNSKKSLWPIQLTINELPIRIRFAILILAGLWYAPKEPHPDLMNLYLKYLTKSLRKLYYTGINFIMPDGESVLFRFFLFTLAVDSKARPVMQNRFQYNGRFGCSWCYKVGKSVNNYIKYPEDGLFSDERSHKEYLKDIEAVKRLKKSTKARLKRVIGIRGVKGSSILTKIPIFDCVWGFSLEYMHAILIGVTQQLWEHWSSIFPANSVKKVNDRLTKLKPSRQVHRLPVETKGDRTWNASDWEYWLLFFSVVCLDGILNEKYMQSYILLVKSVAILLSQEINEMDLIDCEINILQFVKDCQIFYGEPFMRFNIHILLHLVESVKKMDHFGHALRLPTKQI